MQVVEHDNELLASTYDMQVYVRQDASSTYASGASSVHLAMLEGAVSSVLAHPHVVQTYDWQPAEATPQAALLTSSCRVRACQGTRSACLSSAQQRPAVLYRRPALSWSGAMPARCQTRCRMAGCRCARRLALCCTLALSSPAAVFTDPCTTG